ncbi:MAG: STAS-like domain-containing protein [Thiobacillus sp.]|jgi:hypothetical protein
MDAHLECSKYPPHHFFGTRFIGQQMRGELEALLDRHQNVEVDFTGLNATQSFIDEMIGVLVLRYGSAILTRLAFKGCNEDIQTILHFVVSSRLADHEANRQVSTH